MDETQHNLDFFALVKLDFRYSILIKDIKFLHIYTCIEAFFKNIFTIFCFFLYFVIIIISNYEFVLIKVRKN
jgi:hypothetical protein